MNYKIIAICLILLFSVCCLNSVFGESNATETLQIEDYIMPISVFDDKIEFNDGFTGFCIDSGKNIPTTEDNFTCEPTSDDELQNHVKLTIIECYKQNREKDIGNLIESLVNGASDDELIKEVLNSDEKIGDKEVVDINNTTEATFEFELLKSVAGEKSDCLGYAVSLKTVEDKEILESGADDSEDIKSADNTKDVKTQDSENKTKSSENIEKTDDSKDVKTQDSGNKTNQESDDNKTVVNETNRTIINKTNTVIVNENNTTVINQNNIKTINHTTKETPQNDTVQNLLKQAGNPIFILILVIIIIAVAAVVMHRKD